MKRSVEQRAASVEALVFDVDGVLTAGQIIYPGADGEVKIFDAQDGHGIHLARKAGLRVGFLTGRISEATRRRAVELKVDSLTEGPAPKGSGLRAMLAGWGIDPSRVAYVGDDLVDLPALRLVGLPVAVANAAPEVKAVAAYVTVRPGGAGAAREVVELVLKARGAWDALVAGHEEQA